MISLGEFSFDAAGAAVRITGGTMEITDRKQTELQLRRYQHVVETCSEMLLFLDRDLCYQLVNPSYAAMYQTTPERLQGRQVHTMVGEAIYARIGPELNAALTGEPRHFNFRHTFPDGQCRYLEAHLSPFWIAGAVQGVVVTLHDVTAAEDAWAAMRVQQTHLEAALREAQMARIDVLTGIANRAGFEDRLAQAYAHARRHGRRFGLIFLDLDGFKAINDTRGHQVGDQVLREVAASLTEHCRPEDLAGRYGGDEFALLLSELADAADAVAVAGRVRDGIAALDWDGCRVSASLGVALYPDSADDLLELIRQADQAMYASKTAGKDRVTLAGVSAPPAGDAEAGRRG
jgi:diguanylate cyclase (GGDEF)-like protein/PAS domain S-box-containing protein